MGHIIIISGPPGAGKSTIARMLAENSPYEHSVHVHTDDFYGYIRKGYIEPHMPESSSQNIVVSNAILSCAKSFVKGGYEVLVDGVVGTWHLSSWIDTARNGIDIHYAILRPDLEMTISRNANRSKKLDSNMITHMWNAFTNLGLYESHAIDTTNQNSKDTAIAMRDMLNQGHLRIV